MARPANTYRGYRRNAARKCIALDEWGKSPLVPWTPNRAEPHKIVLVRPLPRIMREAVAKGLV